MSKTIHIWFHDSFNEADHPRADNGKFGSGSGGGSSAAKHQVLARRRLKHIPKDENGLVRTRFVFAHPFDEAPMRDSKKGFKEHTASVNTSAIIPTQEHVKHEGVAKYVESGERQHRLTKQLPEVIKDGDKYYLMDGHHRVSADIFGGKQSIQVRVVGDV